MVARCATILLRSIEHNEASQPFDRFPAAIQTHMANAGKSGGDEEPCIACFFGESDLSDSDNHATTRLVQERVSTDCQLERHRESTPDDDELLRLNPERKKVYTVTELTIITNNGERYKVPLEPLHSMPFGRQSVI